MPEIIITRQTANTLTATFSKRFALEDLVIFPIAVSIILFTVAEEHESSINSYIILILVLAIITRIAYLFKIICLGKTYQFNKTRGVLLDNKVITSVSMLEYFELNYCHDRGTDMQLMLVYKSETDTEAKRKILRKGHRKISGHSHNACLNT